MVAVKIEIDGVLLKITTSGSERKLLNHDGHVELSNCSDSFDRMTSALIDHFMKIEMSVPR